MRAVLLQFISLTAPSNLQSKASSKKQQRGQSQYRFPGLQRAGCKTAEVTYI
jgi:hypothetical protein